MKKVFLLILGLFFHSFLIADYAYDANGNISSIYIPGNGEVLYEYDPIHRLTQAHYPNGKRFLYTYDFNSNLKSTQGPEGTTTYSYDKLNRIQEVELPDKSKIAYTYDLRGRVTHLTYPDEEVVEYQYDTRGRLIVVQDGEDCVSFEYDDLTNQVVKETLPNGVTTEYVYDTAPRVLEVLHRDNHGKIIVHFFYAYDLNGNCTLCRKETPKETKKTEYSYDALDRLIRVEDEAGNYEKYTYDEAGNRLTKSTEKETIQYRYDNKNRLIQAGETTYEYDIVGNLVHKTSPDKEVFYSYDPTGRLIAYSDGHNQVQFGYDGQGRRTSKTVNGETTYFVQDPQSPISRVLIEKDKNGNLKQKYIYGHSRVMQKRGWHTHYFLYDQPGKSVSHIVPSNGNKTAPLHYDSFGNLVNTVLDTPYGYNGEELDAETGLIFLRNRYYDPEIGRFISPDFVLGSLTDPQTLNPYVFVRNNPLGLIDPLGLYAVKVPLTLYGNYPGTQTPGGKSVAGHGWIGGVDQNNVPFTQGAWPGNLIEEKESLVSFNSETIQMTLWVTPEQSLAARLASSEPKWTAWNNCIDHVEKALDAIDYPHPTFKDFPKGISLPTIYCDWLVEEKNHIHPNFLPQNGDLLMPSSFEAPFYHFNRSLSEGSFFHPNYGGVALDKSAEVHTELNNISGVVFDEQMGQMILYGRKDRLLPRMEMDDLAVAVRSIYGLGSKGPEIPGVSMSHGPIKKKKKPRMIVSYYGETENTHFGNVMFEADRVLKSLSIGKDNITGKKIKSSVPGYRKLLKLPIRASEYLCRLWFAPKKITLTESKDNTSMIFNEAQMEVLTESNLWGEEAIRDEGAEIFATHFTQNYDLFAKEYPILHELKRLGKITAIVKWINEKNLPFDLTFFQNYSPKYIETPTSSPMILEMRKNAYISGGVVYTIDENNYVVQKDSAIDQIKEEVLQERPDERSLVWDFGNGYTAVARNVTKALKVGEVSKTFIDIHYPGLGMLPLSFSRIYSSFNEERSSLGKGWEITPARLRFPKGLTSFAFNDGAAKNAYPEIVLRLEGIESIYTLAGLNNDLEPIYRKKYDPSFLVLENDGNYLLQCQNVSLRFNPHGHLTHIQKANRNPLEYHYKEDKLVKISIGNDTSIDFGYTGNQITLASGPGGKVLFYAYDSENQLMEVGDREGLIECYEYDEGGRLTAIVNGRGNTIFKAKYDEYNRAQEQIVGEHYIAQSFDLKNRAATLKMGNNYLHEEYFDSQYRPTLIVDSIGKHTEWSYGQNYGPQKMQDNSGLEVDYEYDAQGHLIAISDAFQGERFFEYDSIGRVISETDGEGIQTGYRYNASGQLIEWYRPFSIQSIQISDGQMTLKANSDYLTSFEYDDSGHLLSKTFPDGQKETYSYNTQGLCTHTTLSNGIYISKEYDDRYRVTSIQTQGLKEHFEYDDRDHIKKRKCRNQVTTFSYDTAGNLSSQTDALNRQMTYEYDSFERITKAIDPLSGVTSYEYNSSLLHKATLPNASTREIFYDEYARPVSIR